MICTLCPRNCAAERTEREGFGVCRVGTLPRIARAALHMWEEPCISGTRGSGAIFFSGCNLHCAFCQNEAISHGGQGETVSVERLADIFRELEAQGAHNINLVTATHFVPAVIAALDIYRPNIPIVYNCGGYEKVEALKRAEGLIDIYLPDFKYLSPSLAKRYSHAEDYPETAKAALAEMVRQQSACRFRENDMLQKGVIVRHMMLPGNLADSKAVITYLHETYGEQILLSIMNQFTPTEALVAYPEINRKVTEKEYDALIDYAISIGVEEAYIQEGETATDSFIPDFSNQGV